MPFLHMDGLAKSFGETTVLEDFSIALEEGQILALLGLSGSGKTTALRLLAGFERPDRGSIHVAGKEVTSLAPETRGFGMVFQHYALFPHMTVAENVAFGLEARGRSKEQIRSRVAEMLALVHLEGYGARRVSAISGGQQQRVALARALAPEPPLLLLDEPLSNLDPALRESTREELRTAVRRLGITTVLVTHEQEEAFHVGDRIAVLHGGRLQQVDTAVELYRRPATPFVASFIGRSSRLVGTWVEAGETSPGGVRIPFEGGSRDVVWRGELAPDVSVAAGEEVALVVRPESLSLSASEGLPGKVEEMRFTGVASYAVVALDGEARRRVHVRMDDDSAPVGEAVRIAPRGNGPVPRIFPLAGSESPAEDKAVPEIRA